MKRQEQSASSCLFLVRLWQSKSKHTEPMWSGRVVHITSGKASDFLQLSSLTALLIEMSDPDATDARKSVARHEASAVAAPTRGTE